MSAFEFNTVGRIINAPDAALNLAAEMAARRETA